MQEIAFRQVHLDFHTSEQIPGIGSEFEPAQFVETLRRAAVNSITLFSRCHHGMIYHDTKFAELRHPGLKGNLLAQQVEACHSAGIRAPIYITVGWDEAQSRRHPEWLQRSAEGRPFGAAPLDAGWHRLCFNSPYIDFVWEQTAEVLQNFAVDGLFFDIITQEACLCENCLTRMVSEGVDPADSEARTRFARRTIDAFKQRFTAEIRELNGECSIFYNSGHVSPQLRPVADTYSHFELESLPSGGWGYMHFPLTVRYARTLGKELLGMTGKFHKSWGDFNSLKTPAALEYECFMMLAEGAKCSVGDQLHPRGRLDPATYDLIGHVYHQVEAKEPWCQGARAITEIGIFTPEAIGVNEGRVDPAATGALRMLRERHYQADVVDGEGDWSSYRVVILPDKIPLDDALAAKVRGFLKNGGSLILSYESGLDPSRSRFALDELGVELAGPAEYAPDFVAPREALARGIPATQHVLYEAGLNVRPHERSEVLADLWHPYFNRAWDHFCSHSHTPPDRPSDWPGAVQRGSVIYFAHPLFGMYTRHGSPVYRDLVLNALKRLLPKPLVETDAPSTAHVTLLRQPEQKRTVAHVLHYLPQRRHPGFDTLEDVIPLRDVSLSVRLGKAPASVYLAPSREPLAFECSDERVSVTIPVVRGHAMVVFQEGDREGS
jgi:hypothetical protein